MEKTYFSFMGYCKARKVGYIPTNIQSIHQIDGGDWDCTLYKSSSKDLMFICKTRYVERQDWYFGDEYSHSTGGYHEEKWYSVLKKSWQIEPACPVEKFASEMEQALAY